MRHVIPRLLRILLLTQDSLGLDHGRGVELPVARAFGLLPLCPPCRFPITSVAVARMNGIESGDQLDHRSLSESAQILTSSRVFSRRRTTRTPG